MRSAITAWTTRVENPQYAAQAERIAQLEAQRSVCVYPTDAAALREIVDQRDRYVETLDRLLCERAATMMSQEDKIAQLEAQVAELREALQSVVNEYPVASGRAHIIGGEINRGYGSIRRAAETLAALASAPVPTEGDAGA